MLNVWYLITVYLNAGNPDKAGDWALDAIENPGYLSPAWVAADAFYPPRLGESSAPQ